MKARQKALFVAEIAKRKLAEDIVVLDMRKLSSITDFFIIASASSTRRAQTIAETIEKGLLDKKETLSSIEGYQDGGWILIDAYEVVTHIFNRDLRDYYNLESLWSDAPRVSLCRRKRKKYSKKTSKRR